MSPEEDAAAALVADLSGWLDRLFPDRDRGRRLKAALDERFGGDERPVTEELCRDVEAVARSADRMQARRPGA